MLPKNPLLKYLGMLSESDVYSVEEQSLITQEFQVFLNQAIDCARQNFQAEASVTTLPPLFAKRLLKILKQEDALPISLFNQFLTQESDELVLNKLYSLPNIVGKFYSPEFTDKHRYCLYHLFSLSSDLFEPVLEICCDPLVTNKGSELETCRDPLPSG